jgi:hypothetical protein
MKTYDDGLGGQGVPIHRYCEQNGLSLKHFKWLCQNGNISGAKLHPKQRTWWIYPPVFLTFST